MKRTLYIILAVIGVSALYLSARNPVVKPSYAWRMVPPLGLREAATIDTLPDRYAQRSVPSEVSDAWASTGNLGGEGINMIWAERPVTGDFFLNDAVAPWVPSPEKTLFYNTRIPMTLLSYNTAGGRDNSQERLSGVFSGNINARAQVGAFLDYLYSKGCYADQAAKDLAWGFSGSYIGPRYQMQAYFYHYSLTSKENGGITDPLYITDPAVVQGGVTSVDNKSIPVNLSGAHSRFAGTRVTINNRYNVGFWRTEEPQEGDTVERRTYVPVTSFIWTLDYVDNKHSFICPEQSTAEDKEPFFANHYLTTGATHDRTTYSSVKNTVGVSLLEGFNKYAKFGLAAYLSYTYNKYNQTPDTLSDREGLTPLPDDIGVAPNSSEHLLAAGAQLTKEQGSWLRYRATAELGFSGRTAGDVKIDGLARTNIPIRTDTLAVTAFARFHNTAAPYLLENFISNHFAWQKSLGKVRRLSFGGAVDYERTGTHAEVMAENIQNHIYFGPDFTPVQHGGSVQVLSARLRQNLRLGILHWDNQVTYQTTTDDRVIPLPKLAVYSNLYLKFKIATLYVQLGVDCDYYTRYYAPRFQPATATFANQHEVMLGNYPFMNAYANFKLSKTRFYVMMSHVNQGWFSRDYFALPDYPMNPRRFQIGLSIDFAN